MMDSMKDPESDLVAEEMMTQDDSLSDEEVEFVNEAPLRPVLECIDLVSDEESQSFSPDRNARDHVAATLDRLAYSIEVKKKKQAEEYKAFQEKLISQRAHGLQQIALNKDRPGADAARFCVSQWLKMPGLKPGNVNSSRRTFSQPREIGSIRSGPIACPVMHCNRNFDNQQLLLGHLKRFDHSPCDPAICLQGACDSLYACLVCQNRFANSSEYANHLAKKVILNDGHHQTLSPLVIQCFACPCCFLLYNQRDDCLKHMSDKNHFVRGIKLSDEKGIPCPIAIPSYAKRVLIALCKDVPFQVLCTSCRCELRTHMELNAHFRIQCRNSGPVAISEKSIADVASVFRLKAFCITCRQGLSDEAHISKHIAKTSHNIQKITSMEQSILAFCYLNDGLKTPSDFCLSVAQDRMKYCTLKRTLKNDDDHTVLPKCSNDSGTANSLKIENCLMTAWFCECSQQFSSEKDAEKHIMTANSISHKCLVCGKLADDTTIIRLHMCRFHGGARLDSFLFWCKMCKTELPRFEDVLMHIVESHGSHSFFYEQEVPEEPSISIEPEPPEFQEPDSSSSPQRSGERVWQCHICEETFDTEETVIQHCKSLSAHQFHKYSCETCKKKFHKIETILRHCQLQHDGNVQLKYFCGLCEDVFFEEEAAFLEHYKGFHSLDYSYIANEGQSNKHLEAPSSTSVEHKKQLTCGCLAVYSVKAKKKEDGNHCLARLFSKGKLWYSCTLCSATHQTLNDIQSHVCKNTEKTGGNKVVVKCSTCSKTFEGPKAAQAHYHTKHCYLKEQSKNSNFPTAESIGEPSTSNNFQTAEPKGKPSSSCNFLTARSIGKPNINFNLKTAGSMHEVFTFTASGTSVKRKHAKKRPSHTKTRPSPAEKSSLNKANTSEFPNSESTTDAMEIESSDLELIEGDLPDVDFLSTMTHIVFIDFDNWAKFFSHLPGYLNQGTFVWGFQGGNTNWKPPVNCKFYRHLSNTGCFYLHPRCSNRKDAADFAICVQAGRLDERLPKQIPFTVLSGDQGFLELENQFKNSDRSVHILNPHHTQGDMMVALLNSIAETTHETRCKILLMGDSYVSRGAHWADSQRNGRQLGVPLEQGNVSWMGFPGMMWGSVVTEFHSYVEHHAPPHILLLHCGGNSLGIRGSRDLIRDIKLDLKRLWSAYPGLVVVWSDMVGRTQWRSARSTEAMNKARIKINKEVARFITKNGGLVVRHYTLEQKLHLQSDGVHLDNVGMELWFIALQEGLNRALNVYSTSRK